MAPAMRSMLALCAPAAITAFVVNPGSVFRSAATGVPAVNTASPTPAGSSSSPSLNRAAIGAQQRAAGGRSAVGALFAKALEYEVTSRPSTNSSVILTLDIPGPTTKLCYEKAVRTLSKQAGNTIPGFGSSKNNKHPADVIERHFGIEEVKGQALKVISEVVINKAINEFDFKAIGSAELVQDVEIVTGLFTPGSPMLLEVKCDVWPEIKMVGEYTGFDLEVEEPPLDEPRVEAAWKALRERNVVLQDTAEDYTAVLGDSVIANMEPFRENKDGSRGDKLPEIASGDGVDIVLESGRYMPGLAEGMEGVKVGEKREIRVTFPDQLGPQGGDLEGTKAIFEVEALEIKNRILPEVNEAFAQSIRKDLTLEALTKEVENAVMEETGTSKKDARNRALEDAILAVTEVEIPETLIIEQAREKFAIMMTEFKDQGQPDEQIQKMITKENFLKYVEVVRKNTTRGLSLGLLFTYIAEKEGIEFDPREVVDQLDLVRAQAKGQGQDMDEAAAKDKIEAQLERDLVLDFVAERSTIKWLPARPVEEQAMPKPSP
eukprot:jgi/Undpi1/8617/HiC_scaffold_25.g11082.m1